MHIHTHAYPPRTTFRTDLFHLNWNCKLVQGNHILILYVDQSTKHMYTASTLTVFASWQWNARHQNFWFLFLALGTKYGPVVTKNIAKLNTHVELHPRPTDVK